MTMVHHTGLCPADLDASLRFYRDGIGLTVLRRELAKSPKTKSPVL